MDHEKELTKIFTSDVNKVIKGELKIAKTNLVCCNDVIGILKPMPGFALCSFENNGFQWDFWQFVLIDNVSYLIEGSGFYGGLSFSRSE